MKEGWLNGSVPARNYQSQNKDGVELEKIDSFCQFVVNKIQ
jgi:hypothetical protein